MVTQIGSVHCTHGQMARPGRSQQRQGAGREMREDVEFFQLSNFGYFSLQRLNLFKWFPQQTYAEDGAND